MPIEPSAPSVAPHLDREATAAIRGALLGGGPISIVARPIPGAVTAALDALPSDALPELRYEGSVAGLRPELRRAVTGRIPAPRWLANWLVDDVVEKAELMAELTSAPALRVRLDVIDDDRCRKFHVDDVRLRLLTTYRGPGTQWVSPQVAARLAPGALPPDDAIRNLPRGHVALMRGGKGGTAARPGILHRSPPIAGSGVVRLFLAIDETRRQVH